MDEEDKMKQADLSCEFWRAVLTMRNHTILFHKADYWDDLIAGRSVQGSLWEAINIVGNQLDNAIGEGLLDDRD